jgi:threonyl-tRNA synthetase
VLTKVLDSRGVEYRRMEGEAAFYGPKIDVKVVDAIGRVWQLTTVQVDFNLPERFDLHSIGADNTHHRPFMVHRALLGSIERFFGILIEHFAGDFPLWLTPVQAKILPISEKFLDYAKDVEGRLQKLGIRARVDTSDEKLGYKIRKAELEKVPYSLVVGAKEVDSGTVGVRKRHQGDLGAMTVEALHERLAAEVAARR